MFSDKTEVTAFRSKEDSLDVRILQVISGRESQGCAFLEIEAQTELACPRIIRDAIDQSEVGGAHG